MCPTLQGLNIIDLTLKTFSLYKEKMKVLVIPSSAVILLVVLKMNDSKLIDQTNRHILVLSSFQIAFKDI